MELFQIIEWVDIHAMNVCIVGHRFKSFTSNVVETCVLSIFDLSCA